MKKVITPTLPTLLVLLTGCFKTETKDPGKAFTYWYGSEPPAHIEMIRGQYFQSPHFTLEYEVFLKFRTNNKWFNGFAEYRKLEIDTVKNDWTRWTELPRWFKPDQTFLIYAKDPKNEFETSRYFFNPDSGICYIFETAGM
ncbi:hypothetical protein [Flavihumibacter petaseus]|uniref:Lipoprotein n=1 Tax=Flavihumibacter petaseus NBRC 106054 TaxID=1220578 RepID=A0A0E9MV08_9BACT|nr:hypothetical protein [Flavihumibacter petaseus]GAO41394.1 hypothetical protein FPE01S_01_04060 [Flavihumibacter petaseus NBRC 106054]